MIRWQEWHCDSALITTVDASWTHWLLVGCIIIRSALPLRHDDTLQYSGGFRPAMLRAAIIVRSFGKNVSHGMYATVYTVISYTNG